MINTNINGVLNMSKFTLNQFKKNTVSHIINIGSIAAQYSYANGAVYSATKSAVKFISDGLRKEVYDKKIKITTVQPGLVKTNFSNIRFKGDIEKAKQVYKGIKALSADDIADIVLYIITQPDHVQISEITIMPIHQASVDTIYKK
jgi:NADP-dependent 3-hydroxy acid dehydrogenase YdfG